MATISLCMIVKNEEAVLARCLECVKDAVDEIIIADTGSTDRTKEIAAQFTDRIYDFPWTDDFAEARNFVFSKASMDYQMWLDADDVMDAAGVENLIALKENLTADVVMLPYHVGFDDGGNPIVTNFRERLLRQEKGFRWEGAVHEAITPSGTVIYGDAAVLHQKVHVNDPDRNLRILEKQLAAGKPFTPRQMYYYARELFWHERYRDAIKAFTDFLKEPSAWVEDKINACLLLAQCCRFLGNTETALFSLYRSFHYDRPRAEICCEIGSIFMEQRRWSMASYWYERAAEVPVSVKQSGFSQPDCHDFIPYIQLCVCHDRMGNHSLAAAYNAKAGRIKPNDASFLANQRYFQSILKA